MSLGYLCGVLDVQKWATAEGLGYYGDGQFFYGVYSFFRNECVGKCFLSLRNWRSLTFHDFPCTHRKESQSLLMISPEKLATAYHRLSAGMIMIKRQRVSRADCTWKNLKQKIYQYLIWKIIYKYTLFLCFSLNQNKQGYKTYLNN